MYFFRFRDTAKKHLCLLNPKKQNIKKTQNKKKEIMKSTQFQAIIKPSNLILKTSECTCAMTQTKVPQFQNQKQTNKQTLSSKTNTHPHSIIINVIPYNNQRGLVSSANKQQTNDHCLISLITVCSPPTIQFWSIILSHFSVFLFWLIFSLFLEFDLFFFKLCLEHFQFS